MQPIEEKNPRWFVYSSYQVAGRPKLETSVMNYADVNYMCTLISESEMENVVADLNAYADRRRAENPRLKPCEIEFVKNTLVRDHANIFIGAQNLSLMKVRAVVE